MSDRPRPYILAETNWKAVKEESFTVAILPWGATEAHNYHLPYATDNILAENVAVEAAKWAWEKDVRAIVLPTVPFGVNTGQIDVPLCINMNPSTQYALIKDIAQVLDRHKIHKLVILNAHGGNHFKQMIRELSLEYPNVFTCSINWWQVVDANDYFEEPGNHAGELETSTMLFLNPELVLPLKEAGDGKSKTFRIKGLKEGWASAQRKWTAVTKDTGVGDPKLSTAEKGERFFKEVVKTVGNFLEELHRADIEDMYEG